MKVLVLGGGGREHALIWKIKQSSQVDKLFCLPGNGGIDELAERVDIPMNSFDLIKNFITDRKIDLTIVGPEQPLVDGIVDYFEAHQIKVFGPLSLAARLEGSKIFAKRFMQKHNIPTANYAEFSEYESAQQYLKQQQDGPIVVKADGLAAGKGSIVCGNIGEALSAIKTIMQDGVFGKAGNQVVIEECMKGEETSLFVLTDGKDYALLSPAQDFKRALDGDNGKNTGGMGSYAPTPVLTNELLQKAIKDIVEPVLEGFKADGILYRGMLYVGLMLTEQGPKVVEFNCRFGDPETQVVLPLLENDLVELFQATVLGKLGEVNIRLKSDYAVCVIAASGGYPDAYEKGKMITGLDEVGDDVTVFHAGTQRKNGEFYTSGGRVLSVMGTGPTLKDAQDKAYRNISKIHFEAMQYRHDIGSRILNSFF
ncbi:MAG: phosphoribosylamine--glycine ligase [Calditrichia bacterium]|nr:phosphoribosylamine--glycine ligase [Calditrichia bacterium]